MKENNTSRLPLEGIRIADFTWAWAGPYATMLLAFLGAEVIKIESMSRPDHARIRSLSKGLSNKDIDRSPVFNELNLNKMSLSLNLKNPKAVDLARRLISISDVVAENYRPGVMDKTGLGYEVCRGLRPDIIMLSSSAMGSTGPERNYTGFAPTFAALGGAAHLTGYPDRRPVPLMGSSDLRSAATSAFAVLAALYHRARTGRGQHIDLSSTETIAINVSDSILDYVMNGRVAVRNGNRDEAMAPHNCYPCRDDDSWISIAVATDEEWSALCGAMGSPALAEDERFSDAYRRWCNQDELDRIIAAWTARYTPYESMDILQKAGVAAAPTLQGTGAYDDPHLRSRDFAASISHVNIGKRTILAPPWKFSDMSVRIKSSSPMLGEHNEYVLGELLGISKEEIKALEEEGALS